MASKSKTALNATQVPFLIIAGGSIFGAISNGLSLGWSEGECYQLAAMIYGGVQGFVYWIKNRKK